MYISAYRRHLDAHRLKGISMKLCLYDAWLYRKVNLLKYKAAFYSLKRKREKKNVAIVLLFLHVFCLAAHRANFKIIVWCCFVH